MALNFPINPVTNAEHISGINRWVYNGSAWEKIISNVAYVKPLSGIPLTDLADNIIDQISNIAVISSSIAPTITATRAITDDIANNKRIVLDEGRYVLETQLTLSGTNLTLTGAGFGTLITSNLREMIKLGNCQSLTIENMTIQSTSTETTENFFGLISAQDVQLLNITIRNVKFIGAAGVNSIKIINETTNITDGFKILDCLFTDTGRMGIEFQNHAPDPTPVFRFGNVVIDKCKFESFRSLNNPYPFSISLSGYASHNIVSSCTMKGGDIGVELIGQWYSKVSDNTMSGIMEGFVSLSGDRRGYGNLISDNIFIAGPNAITQFITTQDNITLSGNYFKTNSILEIRDCNEMKISDCQFVSTSNIPIFITGTSKNIHISDTIVDASSGSLTDAVVGTIGTGLSNIIINDCVLKKATNGNYFQAFNGAILPRQINTFNGDTFITDSDAVSNHRNGLKYFVGLRKVSSTNSTSISITLGSPASWEPSIITIKVATSKNNNLGQGYANSVFMVKNQGTNNVVVISAQSIGSADVALSAVSNTSGTFVVTAQHASVSGPELYFIWDIEVTSVNVPTII